MKKHQTHYFIYIIAFVWLWSGLQPILSASETSLTLLEKIGVPTAWQYPTFIAASLLDIGFALSCFSAWRNQSLFWLAQFLTVLIYSIIIAFKLPEMWLHPFAPLIKNLPILAILFFLYQQNGAKS